MSIVFPSHGLLPGAKVRLRTHPEGEPGIIERIIAGKAVVKWPNCTTRHTLDRLVAVTPAASRENPYSRLLRRLREDNERSAAQ